jgi:hypothetical protein
VNLNTTSEERDAAETRLRECVTELPDGAVVFDYMTDVTRKLRAPDIRAVLDELTRVREELESAMKVVAAGREVIRLLHGNEPPFSNIDAKRVALLNLENALGRFGGRE